MRANRRNLEFAARGQRGQTTAQLRHMHPGIVDVAANFRAQLDHRLMHLRLDLLFEGNFAVFENFVNVRAQLPRLGIDNGKFLLDAQGEDVIFETHEQSQCCAKNRTLSSRGSARILRAVSEILSDASPRMPQQPKEDAPQNAEHCAQNARATPGMTWRVQAK